MSVGCFARSHLHGREALGCRGRLLLEDFCSRGVLREERADIWQQLLQNCRRGIVSMETKGVGNVCFTDQLGFYLKS